MQLHIIVGARSSPLSRVQVEEVERELFLHHPTVQFTHVWASSPGDRDHATSLRDMGQTDFFTQDLDRMLLRKEIRIAMHSAKDLPDPIPRGISLVALTKGVDPRDSLVFRGQAMVCGGVVAVSSKRREEALRQIDSTLSFIDVRGTIGERLALLEKGNVDGIVIAEAALIRSQLTHLHRIILDTPTPPLQGRLAVVARADDVEMQKLFASIHYELPVLRP